MIVMIGTTGLVGAMLAERLLASGTEVHGVSRRASGRTGQRWHEHVAPVADWPAIVTRIGADQAVSALGTTIKAAGSMAAFRIVDVDTVVAFARAARDAGARHIVTVSSVGADPGSRNDYLAAKGDMERQCEAIGFDRLDILRPGLLRGCRGGERRLGERAAIMLSPLASLVLRGALDRFAAIDAGLVADAAAACLARREAGVFRHDNRAILALARG